MTKRNMLSKSENDFIEFDFKYFSEKTPKIIIKKHKDELETINFWYDIWNNFHDVLESSYTDEDPFFLMNIETSANIEASIILAVNGFYRQAITLLRCWFENSMYSIYFHDHSVEFDKWGMGSLSPKKMFMLNFKEFNDYIFQFENFDKFDEIYKKNYKKKKEAFSFKTFRDWIEIIYNETSAYVHGRGFYRSSLEGITVKMGETQFYNKEYFMLWYNIFSNILQAIIISFLLYNPKLMNRFRKNRKLILSSLHDEFKEILVKNFDIKD